MWSMKTIVVYVVGILLFLSIICMSIQLPGEKNIFKDKSVFTQSESFNTLASSGDIDWWPCFGHDPANTCVSTAPGFEATSARIRWNTSVNANVGSSAIVYEGRVYIGTQGGIFCLDAATGAILWRNTTLGIIYTAPSIVGDSVYVGSTDYKVYCFNAITGQLRWSNTTGDCVQSDIFVKNGKVFAGSRSMKIYCFNAIDGVLVWKSNALDGWTSNLGVTTDKIYIGTYAPSGTAGGTVYCFDADPSDGVDEGIIDPPSSTYDLIWTYKTGSNLISANPSIVGDRVYISAGDQKVYCFDADPSDGVDEGIPDNNPATKYDLIWSYATAIEVGSPSAVFAGRVYIGGDSKLLCLNSTTGVMEWNKTLAGYPGACSVLTDGKLYIPIGAAKKLLCLDIFNQGAELWNYTFTTMTHMSYSVAIGPDEAIYLGFSKSVLCFGPNLPPATPATPSGPTEGMVGVSYTFTTQATDPDNDSIQYGWDWGDGSPIEWTGYYNSGEPISTTHTWDTTGTYDIKVKAKDQSAESDWSRSLTISLSSSTLTITAPASVVEDENFPITVTAAGDSVDHATISFSTGTYLTNSTGMVMLTAPSVSRDTPYTITASHEGYTTATKTVTILNHPEQPSDRGWVFGVVYNITGEPVEDATVCILLSTDETGATRQCTFTDNQGRYNSKPTLIGTYTVEVTKDGYITTTKQVTIQKNSAQAVDFTLESSGHTSPPDSTRVQINNAIKNGTVGGEITVNKTGGNINYQQTIYTDITITPLDLNVTEKKISLRVTGNESTGSTIVITLEQNLMFDPANIEVDYDEQKITRTADNLADALNPNDDGNTSEYYIIQGSNETLLFVSIPHFSGHTITISSVVEALGGITAVIAYIVIGTVAAVLFVGPTVVRYLHRRYFRKRLL